MKSCQCPYQWWWLGPNQLCLNGFNVTARLQLNWLSTYLRLDPLLDHDLHECTYCTLEVSMSVIESLLFISVIGPDECAVVGTTFWQFSLHSDFKPVLLHSLQTHSEFNSSPVVSHLLDLSAPRVGFLFALSIISILSDCGWCTYWVMFSFCHYSNYFKLKWSLLFRYLLPSINKMITWYNS